MIWSVIGIVLGFGIVLAGMVAGAKVGRETKSVKPLVVGFGVMVIGFVLMFEGLGLI